jgi:hypothetical protein
MQTVMRNLYNQFFTVDQVMNFKGNIEENQINTFLCNLDFTQNSDLFSLPLDHIFETDV